jgi:hypothetical protein
VSKRDSGDAEKILLFVLSQEGRAKNPALLIFPVFPDPKRAARSSCAGAAVQEAVEVRAERLVTGRRKAMGWTEKDLAARRKGDPAKVKLAAEMRAGTTMPLAWIEERLAMGSRGYLTWLLYRQGKEL